MALDCYRIPQCFHSDANPFIGVKGCSVAVSCPSSGFWINELPGFTLAAGAKTTDNEQISNATEFYTETIKYAIRSVASDLINTLNSDVNFLWNKVVKAETVGKYSGSYLAYASYERGIKVSKGEHLASFIRLNTLEFLANTTATINVIIQDGAFMVTKTADIVAGTIAVINLDYTCDSDEVFVTVDNTAVSVNNSLLNHKSCHSCSSSSHGLSFSGWNGYSTDSKSYGMRLQATLICDHWALLCALKQYLGEIVLFRTAMKVLEERLYGDRINAKTIPKEQINEALLRYKEGYESKLSSFVKSLPKLLNSKVFKECISCRGSRTVLIRA